MRTNLTIRIIAIIVMTAFISSQCGIGTAFALRAQAIGESKATGEIKTALVAGGATATVGARETYTSLIKVYKEAHRLSIDGPPGTGVAFLQVSYSPQDGSFNYKLSLKHSPGIFFLALPGSEEHLSFELKRLMMLHGIIEINFSNWVFGLEMPFEESSESPLLSACEYMDIILAGLKILPNINSSGGEIWYRGSGPDRVLVFNKKINSQGNGLTVTVRGYTEISGKAFSYLKSKKAPEIRELGDETAYVLADAVGSAEVTPEDIEKALQKIRNAASDLSSENPDKCRDAQHILTAMAEDNNLTKDSAIQTAIAKAIPATATNLGHENPNVRRFARWTLVAITENNNLTQNLAIQTAIAKAIPAIVTCLGYEDPDARQDLQFKSILTTIAEMGNLTQNSEIQTAIADAMPDIVIYLSHKDPAVRLVAQQILTAIAKSDNLTQNPDIQTAIAKAMPAIVTNLGYDSSDDINYDIYSNAAVRQAAQGTLKAITESDNLTQVSAIQTAIADVIPAIRFYLEHKNIHVRRIAQGILVAIAESALGTKPGIRTALPEEFRPNAAKARAAGGAAVMAGDVGLKEIQEEMPAIIAGLGDKNPDKRRDAQERLAYIAEDDILTQDPKIKAAIAKAIPYTVINLGDEEPYNFVRTPAKDTLTAVVRNNNLTQDPEIQTAIAKTMPILATYIRHRGLYTYNIYIRTDVQDILTDIVISNNLTQDIRIQKAIAEAIPAIVTNIGDKNILFSLVAEQTLKAIKESSNLTGNSEIEALLEELKEFGSNWAKVNATGGTAAASGDVDQTLQEIQAATFNLGNKDIIARLAAQWKLTDIIEDDILTQDSRIQTAIAEAIPAIVTNIGKEESYDFVRMPAHNTLKAVVRNYNLTQDPEIQAAIASEIPVLETYFSNRGLHVCMAVLDILADIARSDNLTQDIRIQTAIAKIMPAIIATNRGGEKFFLSLAAEQTIKAIAGSSNLMKNSEIIEALLEWSRSKDKAYTTGKLPSRQSVLDAAIGAAAGSAAAAAGGGFDEALEGIKEAVICLGDKDPNVRWAAHDTLTAIIESKELMANPAIIKVLPTEYIGDYLKGKLAEGIERGGFVVIVSENPDEIAYITVRLTDPENGLGFSPDKIKSFNSVEEAQAFININRGKILIIINKISSISMKLLQESASFRDNYEGVLSSFTGTAKALDTWL